MRYKQIAVNPLVIVILISVAFLNIGGCGGEEGCTIKKSNVGSASICEARANTYKCNDFKFEGFCPGGFGCFGNSDNCKLFGCQLGCNNGPSVSGGFNNPEAIAMTTDGDFVVIDSGLDAVVHVDQITGDRTILSDKTTGTGP